MSRLVGNQAESSLGVFVDEIAWVVVKFALAFSRAEWVNAPVVLREKLRLLFRNLSPANQVRCHASV